MNTVTRCKSRNCDTKQDNKEESSVYTSSDLDSEEDGDNLCSGVDRCANCRGLKDHYEDKIDKIYDQFCEESEQNDMLVGNLSAAWTAIFSLVDQINRGGISPGLAVFGGVCISYITLISGYALAKFF